MNYSEWMRIFGNWYTRGHLDKISQWSEKGIDTEKSAEFFLESRVVNLTEVIRCVAQTTDPIRLHYWDTDFWVLELKDGSFQLITNVLDTKEDEYTTFNRKLLGLAKAGSLKECLDKAWPNKESGEYDKLLRNGGERGLRL